MRNLSTSRGIVALGIAAFGIPIIASAQKPPARKLVTITAHVSTLTKGKPDDALTRRLKVPPGFSVSVFSDKAAAPRILAVGDDGTVYATRRDSGDVIALRDDGTGKAGAPEKVVVNLPNVHGMAIDNGKMYLVTINEVYVADMLSNGRVGEPRAIITDLPDAGQHPSHTIAMGPDGMLYISLGSTCNQCNEAKQEAATIVRAKPDGSERGVFARGLRNTIGFAWHPATKEIWGMDNGFDFHGDGIPHEELNHIQGASHFGWPFCYENKMVDTSYQNVPMGSTPQEFCSRSVGSVLSYAAHAAPMQFAFYTGTQFPAEYRNDAFVAMRGSWNREPISGYNVLRVHYENGQATRIDEFLTGFTSGTAYYARPVGVAVARDGSLLVGDDTNGVIYRVTYTGAAAPRSGR